MMKMVVLAAVVVAGGVVTGFSHYVAPRLAGKSKLPNVARFVIGVVLGILAPFAVWIWATGGEWMYFYTVLACASAAGAFTCGAYLADWIGGKGGLVKAVKYLWGSLKREPVSWLTTEATNSKR